MRPETPITASLRTARPRLLALALLAVCIGLTGCVYRMDIQQGNYLDGKAVGQLKVGMTRSQVRYILGTPMVEDVFDKDRWDYIYYYKRGYVHKPVQSRVIVYFSNDKVQRLALYNVPKGRPNGPGRLAPVNKFSIF
ncbi:MAG: outer membrane protein assembly factor BamE [Gammaproteobacteria bacterium]|nr:outer membrane protein assembly factor BamE [Gammaproteobacteria bacterium]